MNVASIGLAPASLSVPSRTPGAGAIPLFGGAGSQLSAFLSLVTGFLEKLPAITPGQIEAPASTASEANGVAVASQDNLSNDTKKHKKEESTAPLPAFAAQESAACIAKPPIAFPFPTPRPGGVNELVTSGKNRNDGSPVQHSDLTLQSLAPVLPAVTPRAPDITFALRLTPKEQTPWPFPISSPVPGPKKVEDAPAWPSKLSAKRSTESIVAPLPDARATPDRQFKAELRAVTSGISQPSPKESKPEAASKRELAASLPSSRQAEGNAAALEVPARPPDGTGASGTHAGRSAGAESHELKIASEPEIKVGLAPPPTRQISLKLSTDDSTRVNVDLTERAGKVQVAVRTPDHELSKSLQTDLGDLVGRLESRGFKTEAWIPAAVHHAGVASQPSDLNTGYGQPQHSGSWSGHEQHGQGQNGSNQRQQGRWTAQLEETLSANNARSESQ